jgi:hypothetical protein
MSRTGSARASKTPSLGKGMQTSSKGRRWGAGASEEGAKGGGGCPGRYDDVVNGRVCYGERYQWLHGLVGEHDGRDR